MFHLLTKKDRNIDTSNLRGYTTCKILGKGKNLVSTVSNLILCQKYVRVPWNTDFKDVTSSQRCIFFSVQAKKVG